MIAAFGSLTFYIPSNEKPGISFTTPQRLQVAVASTETKITIRGVFSSHNNGLAELIDPLYVVLCTLYDAYFTCDHYYAGQESMIPVGFIDTAY